MMMNGSNFFFNHIFNWHQPYETVNNENCRKNKNSIGIDEPNKPYILLFSLMSTLCICIHYENFIFSIESYEEQLYPTYRLTLNSGGNIVIYLAANLDLPARIMVKMKLSENLSPTKRVNLNK